MFKIIKNFTKALIIFLIGAFFLLAISQEYNDFSLHVCFLICFFIHWIVFIPSAIFKTEKYYDLTGMISFLSVVAVSSMFVINNSGHIGIRSIVTILFLSIWTTRLGLFLFFRVIKKGEDKRFKKVKSNYSLFLIWWTMSGLWVFITSSNGIVTILNNTESFNDLFFYTGGTLWITGFALEAISDAQKNAFNADSKNKETFICSGLWKFSRHPNYFGEILLWIGIAVISFPTLSGLQHLTLASPIFIYLLLTRISGINILEKNADLKWGQMKSYQTYKNRTPRLSPLVYFIKKYF